MKTIEPYAKKILADTDLVLVDVGAAYGVPLHLRGLEALATVCYFEPHGPAAEALRKRNADLGLQKAHIFGDALADTDGERTLYVTNAPTGSSLLKPGGGLTDEFDNSDYFYPLKEVPVKTRTMSGVLHDAGISRVDGIKIDVQGAELFVIKGMGKSLLENSSSVEMEIGFPGGYIDQPGFAETDVLMRNAGFSLFDLRVASLHRDYKKDFSHYTRKVFHVIDTSRSLTKRIAEADAIYFKRADVLIKNGDIAAIRRIMVLHCAYGFFVEALDLNDKALAAGLLEQPEHQSIRQAVVQWHRHTKDIVLDWPPVAFAMDRFIKLWQRIQRKLFGRHFARWTS